MPFIPTTAVYLCSVPLEKDQKNQLDFANQAAQHLYFSNHISKSYTAFTYQRKDSVLRVPAEFDELYDCNYVMYQNANFGSKWFYCFVDHMEYVNPNCTNIYLKTDVFQTWMFEAVFGTSFIERQTTKTDGPGEFCEPEPISVKAYPVSKKVLGVTGLCTQLHQCPILYFSKQPSSITGVSRVGFNSGALTMQYGKVYDSIYDSIFTADLALLENAGEMDLIDDIGVSGSSSDATVTQGTVTTETFVDAPFTPKNNKCYNYCFGKVIGDNAYDLTVMELHKNTFDIYSECWWGASPTAFVTLRDIPHTIISFKGYPGISVRTSTYENSINHKMAEIQNTMIGNAALSGARSAVGAFFGNGDAASAAVIGASKSYIDDNLSMTALQVQKKNASLEPDTLSGYAVPAVNFLALESGVYLVRYAPKTEQFRKLDNFFSKFGYAINKVNPVSFKNRTTWDYIKTIDIYISGPIPQDDMQDLKDIFNKGITIWHDPAHFGDYSQNNAPT